MDGLLRLWERIPLPLRIGFAVFSGFMTILGLPSVGDNVADWGTWLSFVGSTVGAYAFPLLGLFGLATFIGLQIAETRARKTPAGVRAMAYRHSADPVATPAESVDHERRLTRENSVLSSDDPLHAALKREREHGLSGLGIAAMASPLLPHTTQDDVAGWEANVRHLLRHEPGLLTMFNYVPPEGSLVGLAYIATVDAVTGGKAAARLRRRLAQLDKVIESL